MTRYRHYLPLLAVIACAGSAFAQDIFDDIYYNPKKDTSKTKTTTVVKETSEPQSYYISNFGDIDVDAYNRRGEQYYVSEIDTIGSAVENGEDFVYTQQIQKFYNPTIVVDNANILDDVLTNARGNVEIVINDYGNPVFAPYSYYGWNWPYYSYAYSPWNWGISIGSWGWNIGWGPSWAWGPSWNWGWGWGPSWSWGPSWNWGWGPGWNPGPPPPGRPGGWRPGPMATWSPGGNRPVGSQPGWGNTTRPTVGNAARPQTGVHRTPQGTTQGNPQGSLSSRPQVNQSPSTTPGYNSNTAHRGVVRGSDGKWQYNTTTPGNRTPNAGQSTTTQQRPTINTTRPAGGSLNTGRPTVNTNKTPSTTTNRNTGTVNRTPSTSNRSTVNTNRTSTPSRSTSGNRSFGGGGNMGGGRSGGGGGGGGRHR